jgi:hypothetical protein
MRRWPRPPPGCRRRHARARPAAGRVRRTRHGCGWCRPGRGWMRPTKADRSSVGADSGCRPATGVVALTPPAETLTRVVCPVARSRSGRRRRWCRRHQVAGQRGEDDEAPVGADAGVDEPPFAAPAPSEARVVVPVTTFRRTRRERRSCRRPPGWAIPRRGDQRAVGRDGDPSWTVICWREAAGRLVTSARRPPPALPADVATSATARPRKPTRRSTQAEPPTSPTPRARTPSAARPAHPAHGWATPIGNPERGVRVTRPGATG